MAKQINGSLVENDGIKPPPTTERPNVTPGGRAQVVVQNLDKPLRHDIRGHLNDIYIQSQALQLMCQGNNDMLGMVHGQMKSVEKIQELLDLTIRPGRGSASNN